MVQEKPKGRSRLPSYLKKRRLLYAQETLKERLKSLGDDYLEEGWLEDALDFYDNAEDLAGLERLKIRAIEIGDASILVRLEKLARIDVTKDDWQRAGEKAQELGKETSSQVCFDRSGEAPSGEDEGKGGRKG